MIFIRRAIPRIDHAACCAIAKTDSHITSFSSIMFSSPEAYAKGWIRVAVDTETGEVLGFTCVRHKVREPYTILYFVMTTCRRRGIGRSLVLDLFDQTPHPAIECDVALDNPVGIKFWEAMGFTYVRDSMGGKCRRLRKVK